MKVGAHAYALLIRTLVDHDCTYAEMSDVTGLHRNTVISYIGELHKAGVVYISQWLPNTIGQQVIKVYKFGSKKDAPRPARQTAAEYTRRYRLKQRALSNPLLRLGSSWSSTSSPVTTTSSTKESAGSQSVLSPN